jgi:ribonuclease D
MIDTPDALQALVTRALDADAVALDTEFVWERTYYAQLGVVQLGLGGDDCHLIDAQALDLAPLGPLLASPDVVKVLHDAVQDLQILHRATGALPKNVFDTQRAAGLAGLSSTTSLLDLLQETVGVKLDKSQTRTDWLQRPLTSEQRHYALEDVRTLLDARAELMRRAEAAGRLDWVEEEMEDLDDPNLYTENPPTDAYDRVKARGISKMSASQRATLYHLAAWREEEARRQDRPRRRILDDSVLGALAVRRPRSPQKLRVRGLDERDARRYEDVLLDVVRYAADNEQDAPPVSLREPDDPRMDARAALAHALVLGLGTAAGIDPGLIGSRADARAFAVAVDQDAERDHPMGLGWRGRFAGAPIAAVLRGQATVSANADGLPVVRDQEGS